MRQLVLALFVSVVIAASSHAGAAPSPPPIDPAEVRAIAKEAWFYAYAPLRSYRAMYEQAVNKDSPGYIGGFNRFRSYAHFFTPADRDIAAPSNDTEDSWAWLDLRAEPIVVSVPAVPAPRYYLNQWFDMWTFNFAYTGVRTTGRDAQNFLFAGPGWKGEVPSNIQKVFRAETAFIGTRTRTELLGANDLDGVKAVQAQYKLAPLSQFVGASAPQPAPAVDWPVWDATKAEGIEFIRYMNALLPFMPTVPSEQEMRARFAKIGMEAGKPFDPDKLDPEIRVALEQGVSEAARELQVKSRVINRAADLYGTRQSLGADYIVRRDLGALTGIYGSGPDEIMYDAYYTGPDGKWLNGASNWVLHFAPGQLPPVKDFWSLTLYDVPAQFLVVNPLDRYSVGTRTPNLKYAPDGSLDIYVQNEKPGPDKEANWLPAPKGPFFMMLRMYAPEKTLLDGLWKPPPPIEIH